MMMMMMMLILTRKFALEAEFLAAIDGAARLGHEDGDRSLGGLAGRDLDNGTDCACVDGINGGDE